MKTDEAVKKLEDLKKHCKAMGEIDECFDCEIYTWAINVAIECMRSKWRYADEVKEVLKNDADFS